MRVYLLPQLIVVGCCLLRLGIVIGTFSDAFVEQGGLQLQVQFPKISSVSVMAMH